MKGSGIHSQVCNVSCSLQVRHLWFWTVLCDSMWIFTYSTETPRYLVTVSGVVCSHSVVSSLVLVVDPVEGFHGAILDAVLGYPFISVTATLGEDS